MIHVDQEILDLLIGGVLPLLVALVTKVSAPSSVKGVLLAFFSVVTGTVVQVSNNGGDFVWKSALISTMIAWATAVTVHFGLWKPTQTTAVVAGIAPNVGIGPSLPNADAA